MTEVRALRPTTEPSGASSRRPAARDALTVFVLAAGLAVATSGLPSLWYDEAATTSAATRTWAQLWDLAQVTNAAQVVYYALLHVWTSVAGTSAVALRLPSALALGAAAAGTTLLARRSLPRWTAVGAGAVVALLPRTAWSGVEARPYALTAAVAVWSVLVLLVALERRAARWWVAYAALAAFGVGLYVYLALLVAAQGLWLLLARRPLRELVTWGVAAGAAAVLVSPLVLLASGQTGQLGIDSRPSPLVLARQLVVNEFFLGDTPTPVVPSLPDPGPAAFTTTWTVAAVLLALLGWSVAVRGAAVWPRGGAALPGTVDRPGDVRLLLVLWLVLPVVVVSGYSLLVAPMYVPRYFTFCAPALALLVAHGLASLGGRRRTTAAVLAGVLLCVPVLASQRTPWAKNGADWDRVADVVAAGPRQDAGVYFAPTRESVEGDALVATTRQAAVAYPSAFRGLRDTTAASSPVQDRSLVGTSRPLAQSVQQLDGLEVLWVVRRVDDPLRTAAADDALLTAQGFTPVGEWRWSQDEVVLLRR